MARPISSAGAAVLDDVLVSLRANGGQDEVEGLYHDRALMRPRSRPVVDAVSLMVFLVFVRADEGDN